MTGPAAERWTLGAYRVLLRLCPRSFRRAYGGEAERVVRDLLRDQRGRGPLWLPRLWARVLGDLLSTAIRERGTQMKPFDWLLLGGALALGLALALVPAVAGAFAGAGARRLLTGPGGTG